MHLNTAKYIGILLLCCHSHGFIQAQQIQQPSPPDSTALAYIKAARELEGLDAFYRQALRFPEDPALRLMMEGKIKEFSHLHIRLKKVLSNPGIRDSLEVKNNLANLISLDSLLREQQKTPPLPLEKAYALTARRHKAGGDHQKAMDAVNKSLLANPSYIPSLSLRCRWNLQAARPEEALPDAQQLAREGQGPAADSLLILLPHFAGHLESLRREEAHTRLLQLTDGLIGVYDFHPPSKAVITAIQEQSRQEMLQAYRNVAKRALAGGKRNLAIRYATMAKTQSELWKMDTHRKDAALLGQIAAYASRSALMALRAGQLRHSLEAFQQADSLYDDAALQQAKTLEYEPLLRQSAEIILDSIATKPAPQRFYPIWHSLQEKHPGLIGKRRESLPDNKSQSQPTPSAVRTVFPDHFSAQILQHSRNLAFRIWQGDTSGYLALRDSLRSLAGFTEPLHLTETVAEAIITLEEAIRTWECRPPG